MHRLYRRQILFYHRFDASAPFLHIPQDAAQNTHIRVGIHKHLGTHHGKSTLADRILEFKNDIDVLIICGGSATDLPKMTPTLAEHFNVIDSFDTHAKIPEHFDAVDEVCLKNNKVALISCGWDPGMFSLARVYSEAILPNGKDYTFWGRGVSQGHSDAIRRIKGVVDARQYTVPIESALQSVRNGEMPEFTARQKHLRECYVVAEEGADLKKIENEIVNMKNYFSDYNTKVNFITEEELKDKHSAMPHGGFVVRSGNTSANVKQRMEFSLELDSNPEFTGSILVAYARAVYKLFKEGKSGAYTVLDIPFSYLSPKSGEELRRELL